MCNKKSRHLVSLSIEAFRIEGGVRIENFLDFLNCGRGREKGWGKGVVDEVVVQNQKF